MGKGGGEVKVWGGVSRVVWQGGVEAWSPFSIIELPSLPLILLSCPPSPPLFSSEVAASTPPKVTAPPSTSPPPPCLSPPSPSYPLSPQFCGGRVDAPEGDGAPEYLAPRDIADPVLAAHEEALVLGLTPREAVALQVGGEWKRGRSGKGRCIWGDAAHGSRDGMLFIGIVPPTACNNVCAPPAEQPLPPAPPQTLPSVGPAPQPLPPGPPGLLGLLERPRPRHTFQHLLQAAAG